MCGRFALSLAPDALQRRVRNEWTPELSGWDRTGSDSNDGGNQSHGQHSNEDSGGPQDHEEGPSSSAPKSKKAALPMMQGYRVGNYNSSPSTSVPVVYRAQVSEGHLAEPQLLSMKWGLVPSWMKEPPDHASSLRTINARDDTVLSGSGLWKSVRGRRRCLIFAEGFYEWQKRSGDKIPHFTKRKDGKLLCMAGLYDVAHLKDAQEPLYSFTIVTTDNNAQLAFLHDRMPVILSNQADVHAWLDTSSGEFTKEVASLLKPFEGELDCYPVPKEVGKTSENSPDFIHPISQRKGNIASFFAKQEEKSPTKKPASSSTVKQVKQERKSTSPSKPDPETKQSSREERKAGSSRGQTSLDGTLRPHTPPLQDAKHSDSDVEVVEDTNKNDDQEPPTKKRKQEVS